MCPGKTAARTSRPVFVIATIVLRSSSSEGERGSRSLAEIVATGRKALDERFDVRTFPVDAAGGKTDELGRMHRLVRIDGHVRLVSTEGVELFSEAGRAISERRDDLVSGEVDEEAERSHKRGGAVRVDLLERRPQELGEGDVALGGECVLGTGLVGARALGGGLRVERDEAFLVESAKCTVDGSRVDAGPVLDPPSR